MSPSLCRLNVNPVGVYGTVITFAFTSVVFTSKSRLGWLASTVNGTPATAAVFPSTSGRAATHTLGYGLLRRSPTVTS
jgi:hypothetical protein